MRNLKRGRLANRFPALKAVVVEMTLATQPGGFCVNSGLAPAEISLITDQRLMISSLQLFTVDSVNKIDPILMSDTFNQADLSDFSAGQNYFGLAHKIISSQLLNLISPPVERKTTLSSRASTKTSTKA